MGPGRKLIALSLLAVAIGQSDLTPTRADTIHVPEDYPTIQSAVTAARDFDTVIVGPGTYTEGVYFGGKLITVRSIDPEDPLVVAQTIINGGDTPTVVGFAGTEARDAILSGFTITGGPGCNDRGINCSNASPTITNCVVSGHNGAGCANVSAGGGIERCHGLITGCTITGNTSKGSGGGILRCHGTIRDCMITHNTVAEAGGGIAFCDGTIIDCTIAENTAATGGGLAFCNGTVSNSTIAGNVATGGGGGLTKCHASVANSLIGGNKAEMLGGGGFRDCDGAITNCTIVRNGARSSGGLFDCNGPITNCIIWDNLHGQLARSSVPSFSNIGRGAEGPGNIHSDPLFSNPDGADNDPDTWGDNDYHLSAGSPCIDAGDNTAVPLDSVDLDDSARLTDDPATPDTGHGTPPLVDMGAYEFGDDCNLNGILDILDITAGTSLDCTGNGIPDECEPDCNANARADSCDIAEGISSDCTGNGIPDMCGDDCNGTGLADSCEILAGTSEDCNDDGIPDECEPTEDCNGNSLRDTCEIADGVTADDNGNGLPDDCEPRVLFVDLNAVGLDNGTSWADAFHSLQDALAVARASVGSVEQIWVAAGTYAPAPPGNRRLATFRLVNGVTIYGGFAGEENTVNQRDPLVNRTILSGDLAGNDVNDVNDPSRDENSYHVVTADSVMDETAMLDGFVITGGHADDWSWPHDRGAGLYNEPRSGPTVVKCTFINNFARHDGGGIYNHVYADPKVISCTFTSNTASGSLYIEGNGGAIYNGMRSNPTIVNCVLDGNSAELGGAIYGFNSEASIISCTATGNFAEIAGGLYTVNSVDTLANTILWANADDIGTNESAQIGFVGNAPFVNYSCIQGWSGGLGGLGNIGEDPLFVDADGEDDIAGSADDNLRLSPGSPCIDAGDNVAVPEGTTTDRDGNARFVDDPDSTDTGNGISPITDMGAYEFQPAGSEGGGGP